MLTPQTPPATRGLLTGSAAGYGLLGCATGLVLGLFGGGLLVAALSMILAVNSTIAPPHPSGRLSPDLRLTLSEPFLNRVVQNSQEENAQLDLLPGNQVRITFDTQFSVLGAPVPIQVTGLFGLQLVGQTLQVNLIDTQAAGLALPPELVDFFDLSALNQEVNQALQEISAGLGRPLVFTGLGTTDTQLWLEASEAP
ncbi:MAG: hypothetical protein AB1801_14300 [Chloroflexota bacterium]